MKKSTTKSIGQKFWNNNLIIGAVSMLIILLLLEGLFAIPSRYLHDDASPKIDIDRGSGTTTNSTSLTLSGSPSFCTKEYMPVCGADGQTYGNRCMANVASTIVAYEGECRTDESGTTNDESGSVNNEQSGSVTTEVVPTVSDMDYSDEKKFHIYRNTRLNYGFSFPKYSWYSAFGARDGASHSMATGLSESDIASHDSAPVRVWFYTTKPVTPPSDQNLTLENGIIYVSSSSADPKIQKIVTDIFASAK